MEDKSILREFLEQAIDSQEPVEVYSDYEDRTMDVKILHDVSSDWILGTRFHNLSNYDGIWLTRITSEFQVESETNLLKERRAGILAELSQQSPLLRALSADLDSLFKVAKENRLLLTFESLNDFEVYGYILDWDDEYFVFQFLNDYLTLESVSLYSNADIKAIGFDGRYNRANTKAIQTLKLTPLELNPRSSPKSTRSEFLDKAISEKTLLTVDVSGSGEYSICLSFSADALIFAQFTKEGVFDGIWLRRSSEVPDISYGLPHHLLRENKCRQELGKVQDLINKLELSPNKFLKNVVELRLPSEMDLTDGKILTGELVAFDKEYFRFREFNDNPSLSGSYVILPDEAVESIGVCRRWFPERFHCGRLEEIEK